METLEERVMKNVIVIDRQTGKKEKETVMAKGLIMFLYGNSPLSKLLAPLCHTFLSRSSGFSKLCGLYQKSRLSRSCILPFIKKYDVNQNEFKDPVSSFKSFNDFFIRTLKAQARPIDSSPFTATCPADGRYLCFQNLKTIETFWIKGKQFNLNTFIQNPRLAAQFTGGSMVIARLCPSDYHRFHFPVSGTPSQAQLINGPLFSVNPLALKKNFLILQENKRMVTLIESPQFGSVAFIEIGATNVGSIVQTYKSKTAHSKGDEKGYFSFGGSCVVLLFEKGKIALDHDLCQNTLQGFETKALMGQSLGKSFEL